MWGNIAKNLVDQTPGNIIARLGDVVAPQLDDDEYEEYYEEVSDDEMSGEEYIDDKVEFDVFEQNSLTIEGERNGLIKRGDEKLFEDDEKNEDGDDKITKAITPSLSNSKFIPVPDPSSGVIITDDTNNVCNVRRLEHHRRKQHDDDEVQKIQERCRSSQTSGTYSRVEVVESIKYNYSALADPIGGKSFAESDAANNGLNHSSAISANTAAPVSLRMKQNKTQETGSDVAVAPPLPPPPPPPKKETVKLSPFQLPPPQPSIPTETNRKSNAATNSSKTASSSSSLPALSSVQPDENLKQTDLNSSSIAAMRAKDEKELYITLDYDNKEDTDSKLASKITPTAVTVKKKSYDDSSRIPQKKEQQNQDHDALFLEKIKLLEQIIQDQQTDIQSHQQQNKQLQQQLFRNESSNTASSASEEQYEKQKIIIRSLQAELAEKQSLDHSCNIGTLQKERLLEETSIKLQRTEQKLQSSTSKFDAELAEIKNRYQRSMDSMQEQNQQFNQQKIENQQEVARLKVVVKDMRNALSEANRRLESVTKEFDTVSEHRNELTKLVQSLSVDKDDKDNDLVKLEGLEMELQVVKAQNSRARDQQEQSAQMNKTQIKQLSSECDAAKQEARDSQQQLHATKADLEIAWSDYERVLTANDNLQQALEAFQAERDAEALLYGEQMENKELATSAAHMAALISLEEANKLEMKVVQTASDKAISNMMAEIRLVEQDMEMQRKENVGLRRSLDEAIHRLQINQEDVIDRSLMKNILLDWFSKKTRDKKSTGAGGRKEVLNLMANVLHFTEDEKEIVGLEDINSTSAFGKVVGVVTAPLPHAALNLDKIEGDNVREKWVNFLLAEAGDDAIVGANTNNDLAASIRES